MTKLLKADKKTETEHRKRLKERFKKDSLGSFHASEIMELVLAYAASGDEVKPIAGALIHKFKTLRGVFDATPDELKSIEGLGENAAVLIKLMKDIAGVYLKERMMGKDAIKSNKDLLDFLNLTLSGERVEKFLAVYLNSRNEVLAVETLHEGTINQTVVYPRKAIEKAFKHNARGVIFVHNHPSGDATPSNVDKQLTKLLDRAALAVDLLVHDHLIIGKGKHFSAKENGWLIGYPVALPRTACPENVF